MKILFVVDEYLDSNNGTTITTRRFAHELMRRGHEVRVACQAPRACWDEGVYVYPQPELRIPVFQGLVDKQGMTLAKANPDTMRAALKWCDVAHFLMPFSLENSGVKMARQMGVPVTAAFHVQPENLSSSIHLGKWTWFNDRLYQAFHASLYRYVDHVHCPSNMIANQLVQHGYTNTLHVISNGIDDSFTYRKLPKSAELRGKTVVTMVGRYSVEKRQDLVIRAVAKSSHRSSIQVVLAGQGPTERSLRRLAGRLGVSVRFGFFSQADLRDLLAMTDVYVHASDMETEAMSCMEAFASGLVPIIANSSLSATPQFALDDRSLFRAGDADDLARHLDWWIDHPQERRRMEHEYAHEADRYRVSSCVGKFEDMLNQAVGESCHESDVSPEGVVRCR